MTSAGAWRGGPRPLDTTCVSADTIAAVSAASDCSDHPIVGVGVGVCGCIDLFPA
jgi:hypothetical protein